MKTVKILLYALMLFPFLLSGQSIITGDTVSASIIYRNIKDSAITVSTNGIKYCSLDLDGDNTMDIRFRISNSYSPGHVYENQSIKSLDGIEFVTLNPPKQYLDTMVLNRTIDSTLHWYATTDSVVFFNYTYFFPNSYTVTGVCWRDNNYIGFRKISATDTIYGWMLLDADLYRGIKVRSWAYENRGSSIGLKELNKENLITVFPNPATHVLHIKDGKYALENAHIEIRNYLGQVVLNQSSSHSIDVSQLCNGLYTLQIVGKNKRYYYSKFIKE